MVPSSPHPLSQREKRGGRPGDEAKLMVAVLVEDYVLHVRTCTCTCTVLAMVSR